MNAGYDTALLALERSELGDLGFDLSLTGFSTTEIDLVLHGAKDADPGPDSDDFADDIPPWVRQRSAAPVTSGSSAATFSSAATHASPA